MTNIYNKYLDVEDFLPENRTLVLDYLCPLCKGIYYKPVVDPCGSIYCRKCIQLCLEKNKTCPSGKAFGPQALITIDFITNVLDKLELYCKNKVSGCNWKGRLANLDEHIEKHCDYQCVRCTNEGCKTVLRKSNLENHLTSCEFKQEECEYCRIIVPRSLLQNHQAECPKMKIECKQSCGITVERSLMEEHILNVCSNSLIDCNFKNVGCDYNSTRSEVENHLKDSNVKHSLLFLKEITQMNSKIMDLDSKFEEITKRLVSGKGVTETNKVLEKESQPETNRNHIKENNRNSILEEVSNGIKERESAKLMTKKRKRSSSSSKENNDIQEIDLDYINNSSLTEDSKPDVVIDSPPRNGKPSKSVISNRNSALKNEISQVKDKELYQEEITIDTLDISKGIEARLNTATSTGFNKNEHKFAMANNILNGSNCKWKVKINKISGWMGVGVCLKELVISNKLKFVGTKNSFMHGTFMISTNKYTWNTNEPKEENVMIENSDKIKAGDEVEFEFDDEKEQLKVFVNGKYLTTLNMVNYPKGNCLVPCVVFLCPGDQVTFSLMTKY